MRPRISIRGPVRRSHLHSIIPSSRGRIVGFMGLVLLLKFFFFVACRESGFFFRKEKGVIEGIEKGDLLTCFGQKLTSSARILGQYTLICHPQMSFLAFPFCTKSNSWWSKNESVGPVHCSFQWNVCIDKLEVSGTLSFTLFLKFMSRRLTL